MKIQLKRTNFGSKSIGAVLSVPNDISQTQAKEFVDKGWAILTEGSFDKVDQTDKVVELTQYPKKHSELLKLAKDKHFNPELHKNQKAKTLIAYLDNLKNAPEKNPEYQKEHAELSEKATDLGIDFTEELDIIELKTAIRTAELLATIHENAITKLNAEIETLKAQIPKGD
jgi:hypothetical protein